MAEQNTNEQKKYLDGEGLKKIFSLIKENIYTKEEVDAKCSGSGGDNTYFLPNNLHDDLVPEGTITQEEFDEIKTAINENKIFIIKKTFETGSQAIVADTVMDLGDQIVILWLYSTMLNGITITKETLSFKQDVFGFVLQSNIVTDETDGIMLSSDKKKLDTVPTMWKGTMDAFNEIETKESDTLYLIYED